ncbi:PTS system fructose subfamily IIA component [Coriobacterium glomerans PW2]|uniref:PTS system fructose subfamily IIA component n=1 Tax=Coriobacterium glomerans (strain ATCC 49209 / DSM 20642 / JCM 10262 / PW2) TaxID=700015 RepID=F2N8K3_CORGP|nr:PTS fructose subfamily transporter subunit IIA [Coriobacterium glomerans]AEB07386.1 PTS system fructose subfamily IIA component [Coriobacterium glomerans PW2]
MANKLVLVTHGDFADGIISSIELVLGAAVPIASVCVQAHETVLAVVERTEAAIAEFGPDEPIVVLTDIIGGSTTQSALRVRARAAGNVYFVVGLNLGLVLEIALLPLIARTRASLTGSEFSSDPVSERDTKTASSRMTTVVREKNEAMLRRAVAAAKEGIGLLRDLMPDDQDLNRRQTDPDTAEL